MEGSLVAYKVFTNGSVLNASEINDNLMNQAVMVFSNSAARTAAITSPVEGMLTWLEDVNRYESYDGSVWVNNSPGEVLISSTTFSAQSSVNFDNVFSSLYDNYKIQTSLTAGTAFAEIIFRMRAGGVTNTSSNYQYGSYTVGAVSGLALTSENAVTATYNRLVNTSADGGVSEITVYSPALPVKTRYYNIGAAAFLQTNGGAMTVTTAYDGCQISTTSGTMSGNIRIYGLRNS
jgi:hypothetical protein